jgi:mRNA interferase MazF
LAISSHCRVTSRPQIEHAVPISAADLVSGALPAASWIRTNRIVTLNVSLIAKTVGRVSQRTVAVAVQQVCAYIGTEAT